MDDQNLNNHNDHNHVAADPENAAVDPDHAAEEQNLNNLEARNIAYRNLDNPAPGMWQNRDLTHCCIYRVMSLIRQAKPEAYTPQLVIIGPLHHSLKVEALQNRGDITNTQAMNYLNMEAHKAIYQAAFKARVHHDIIQRFKDAIIEELERIRASYSESTVWIPQEDFVNMIYLDSVFILEFLLRTLLGRQAGREDHLSMPSLRAIIRKDLMLLENQLPFFILQRLFDLTSDQLALGHENFRALVRDYFGYGRMQMEGTIWHFTDLLRRMYVDTLDQDHRRGEALLGHMYTADKLISARVELAAWGEEPSLMVRFVNGRLEIPKFSFDGKTEVKLRNIMALEQCHYHNQAYVCNHIIFLDFLIDTEKDVEVLIEKGILTRAGDNAVIAGIVNNIARGVIQYGSYNAEVGRDVNNYYREQLKKHNELLPILKRTYFPNLWGTTATIVATIIVISTVGAFIVALIEATN